MRDKVWIGVYIVILPLLIFMLGAENGYTGFTFGAAFVWWMLCMPGMTLSYSFFTIQMVKPLEAYRQEMWSRRFTSYSIVDLRLLPGRTRVPENLHKEMRKSEAFLIDVYSKYPYELASWTKFRGQPEPISRFKTVEEAREYIRVPRGIINMKIGLLEEGQDV